MSLIPEKTFLEMCKRAAPHITYSTIITFTNDGKTTKLFTQQTLGEEARLRAFITTEPEDIIYKEAVTSG